MDIEDLRTFVEVADAGGVSPGARRLDFLPLGGAPAASGRMRGRRSTEDAGMAGFNPGFGRAFDLWHGKTRL